MVTHCKLFIPILGFSTWQFEGSVLLHPWLLRKDLVFEDNDERIWKQIKLNGTQKDKATTAIPQLVGMLKHVETCWNHAPCKHGAIWCNLVYPCRRPACIPCGECRSPTPGTMIINDPQLSYQLSNVNVVHLKLEHPNSWKLAKPSCSVHQNLIWAGINAGAIQKAQAAMHLKLTAKAESQTVAAFSMQFLAHQNVQRSRWSNFQNVQSIFTIGIGITWLQLDPAAQGHPWCLWLSSALWAWWTPQETSSSGMQRKQHQKLHMEIWSLS